MEMEAPFDGLLARCNFHLQGLDNFFYTLINPERRNVCTEKFGGDLVLIPLHRPLSLSLSPPLPPSLSLFRLSTAYFLLVHALLFSNGKFEKSVN